MTVTSATDLAALLCSRLCHDLLSPVGALSNGLELLAGESDPQMRQNCIELLEQSATISTNKLKYFRLAYGAAGGFGERVGVEEPKALIEALAADKGRIDVNWALSGGTLAKPAVKVLLNFAQIALDALVRGGTLDVGAEVRGQDTGQGTGHDTGGGACEIVIRAAGPKIAFDEVLGRAMEGRLGPDELTSRTAPAHMIHLLAQECGGGLQFMRGEDSLVLGAVLPEPEGLIG